MADQFANTTIGLDGVRRTVGDPNLPTGIPAEFHRFSRVLPSTVSVSQAAAATHLVPCTSLEVILNLNNANDNPAVTFANPGVNRYADFSLKLVNADDSSAPELNMADYVVGSPSVLSVVVTGTAALRLKLDDIVTPDFAGDASVGTVQTAIDTAFGASNFVVGGSAGAYTIVPTDSGDYAGTNPDWGYERDEVVTAQINATGGTGHVTFGGQTADVAANAAGSAFQTSLQALSSVGAGNLLVARTGSSNNYIYTLTGAGALKNTNLGVFTKNDADLTGGTATTTITVVQNGHTGVAFRELLAPASTKYDTYRAVVIGGQGNEPANVLLVRDNAGI